MFKRKSSIEVKTPEQLAAMRRAGLVVARTLGEVRDAALPGISTAKLNDLAADVIHKQGAAPSFLGYHGFPAVICTSVNHEVVHGIPSDRVLRDGDLLSVDCGAIVDGWHGDAAITIAIGEVAPEKVALSEVTKSALWAGIAQMCPGNHVGDIGHAIESAVQSAGTFGIVRDFVGHGIGREMHMHPPVPNEGRAGQGPKLRAGMTFAIEPMVTVGSEAVHLLEDDWTVTTIDGGWAAHWEHTVAVTDEGPWVLTAVE